jgi:hypothetical protein
MLSETVNQGKLASSWKTTPTRSGTLPRTCLPSMVTVPAVGSIRPAMISRSVDLPQPDGPTTEKNSPAISSRLSGPSACTAGPPAVDRKTWSISASVT